VIARLTIVATLSAGLLAPAPARAQLATATNAPIPELRVDALLGGDAIVHLGGGMGWPLSTYVRLVAAAGAGARWAPAGVEPSGRADLLARFNFDPLRQSRWALYGAGGLSALWDETEDWRGRLVVLVGLEGPARGDWGTAFELGLGGGVRASVVLRRARPGRR
jgi:hypothetical protein